MKIEYTEETQILSRIQARSDVIRYLKRKQAEDKAKLEALNKDVGPEFEVWE